MRADQLPRTLEVDGALGVWPFRSALTADASTSVASSCWRTWMIDSTFASAWSATSRRRHRARDCATPRSPGERFAPSDMLGGAVNVDAIMLDVAPITIADNARLGGGVIVCPGVTIGQDSVVGAGGRRGSRGGPPMRGLRDR
jgi:hypothetical protein